MNAEILAVGSELLLGQITNTNAQYLSKQLAEIGIDVYVHTVVGDNEARLAQSIELAANRADLVILTGGLGPTKDDLTKETVAAFCGRGLVHDKEALSSIEAYFEKRQRPMSPNNRKQALVIEGSTVLTNHTGMAPGMFLETDKCKLVLMPGPPKELQPMFEIELKPLLLDGSGTAITSRVLRYYGIGESQLETDLEDLIDAQTNPTIAPLAGNSEVKLRLTVKHTDENEAIRLLDETEELIQKRVGEFFYGYGEIGLMEQVTLHLKEAGLTVSAAESFTGGLFTVGLTSFKGSSSIFYGGISAYSTHVKENVLHVSKETIKQSGVVSESCAREMASAVRKMFSTDIGVSFTGVAGPDPQEGKEPGTVYIAIVGPDNTETVYPLLLSGSRQAIRERAVKYCCFYLLTEIKRWNATK
ncbi:competence/damage-inducible protein A [Alkalicoccobacillus plakortidis]|uniref:Putative competence-damage inducible protein n=1 Tax=Alkalicoccobacillus plakortidis TaxID=444060 RepID=A0ABT0XFK4_9BACI|nr:competence/damage-inducible protein A [Alkalicoccobacillus plakortidis]MCM2674676.1 competence/damage-inducible protein A [Alkalicoccobacillus plakortidis]